MPNLNICIGNIGTGKSLLASKFAKMGYAVVNMDALQTMFGGGEYGLYDKEKVDVYHATENAAIESALRAGISVVVDRTNMDRKRRERFIQIGKKHAAKIISYDWGPGDEKSFFRRAYSPHGVPATTWSDVHDYMEKSYEPPSLDEGFDQLVEAPQKFKFYAFDFDGTIVQNKFPEIGEIIDGTVEKMNELWDDLSNIIIIWTNRSGDSENDMRAFLLKRKIMFDFINENPIVNYGSPKIFANEYYDDRNATIT